MLSAWTEPKTLLIGVLTLVAAFTEGTANDWLSVAFVEGYGLPTWAGVLAFATFLSFMTLGRIAGTNLLDRYGRVPTLRVMLVGAGVGSLLVVFGGTPTLAYLGAAIWGVGVSLGFPVGMSAAADDPERAAARISVVATIGYTAFIAGGRRCWASSVTASGSCGPSLPSAPCSSSPSWTFPRCENLSGRPAWRSPRRPTLSSPAHARIPDRP